MTGLRTARRKAWGCGVTGGVAFVATISVLAGPTAAFIPPGLYPSSGSALSRNQMVAASGVPFPCMSNKRQQGALHMILPGGKRGGRIEGPSKRQLRVGRLLQSTLADVIRHGYPIKTADLLDDRIRSKISIVDVDLSPDLRSARVEVSIFGETVEKREAYIWLVNNAKPIRHALSQELRDFRHVPELHFKQTDLSAGAEMFALLEGMSELRARRDDETWGDERLYDEDEAGYESDEEEGEFEDEEEEVVWDEDDEGEVEWEDGEEAELEAWLNEDDEDDEVEQQQEEKDRDELRALMGMASRGGRAGRRRVVPRKLDIGSAGLGELEGPLSWVQREYVPGQLEAELAHEFERLAKEGGVVDDESWGAEGWEEEVDEEEEEEDVQLVRGPATLGSPAKDMMQSVGKGQQSKQVTATNDLDDDLEGWISMDEILDELEGQEDIESLLEELPGFASDEEEDSDGDVQMDWPELNSLLEEGSDGQDGDEEEIAELTQVPDPTQPPPRPEKKVEVGKGRGGKKKTYRAKFYFGNKK